MLIELLPQNCWHQISFKNWKAPRINKIHKFWIKKFTNLHEIMRRLDNQSNADPTIMAPSFQKVQYPWFRKMHPLKILIYITPYTNCSLHAWHLSLSIKNLWVVMSSWWLIALLQIRPVKISKSVWSLYSLYFLEMPTKQNMIT